MANDTEHALSKEELKHWEQTGFIGPYTAWSPSEIDSLLPTIRAAYERPSAVFGFRTIRDRHLDSQAIFSVGTHPAIIERCAELYGPDLILWRSNLFRKRPGGYEIGPHQGTNFPGIVKPIPAIVPAVNITAWVALSDCSIENGCVQFFPGTHHKIYETKLSTSRGFFGRGIELVGLEDIEPVYMEIKRGQFFLFQETVVHCSDVNHSDSDRTGIGFRFTPTSTKVYDDNPIDSRGMPLKRWHTILVSGKNNYGHNRIGGAPQHDDYPNGPIQNLISTIRRRYYKRVHGMQG